MASWWLVAAASGAERRIRITMELTSIDSLDSLCTHLHSPDGSVLTTIWHRWRHRCLDVYIRCPKARKQLHCNSRDKSICMLFFSALWQRNLETTTEKSGQPRSVGVWRRKGRCQKPSLPGCAPSSRASLHSAAPAVPMDNHFIPQAQHREFSRASSAPECQVELHGARNL